MDVHGKRQRMIYDTCTTDANKAEMNDTDDTAEQAYSMKTVSYVLIDNVVTGLTVRFNAAKNFVKIFISCGNIPQYVK